MLTKPGGAGLIPPAMLLLILAGPAAAQTTPMTAQSPEQPTTSQPVRGLEALQANPAPLPVPASPKLVLPSPAPTDREAVTPRHTRRVTPAPSSEPPRTEVERSSTARDAQRGGDDSDRGRPATPTQSASRIERGAPNADRQDATAPAALPSSSPPPASVAQGSPVTSAVTTSSAATPAPPPAGSSQTVATAPDAGRSMPFWLWLAVIPLVVGVLWLLQRRPRQAKLDDRRSFSLDPDGQESGSSEALVSTAAAVRSVPVAEPEPGVIANAGAAPDATDPVVQLEPAVSAPAMGGIATPMFLEPRVPPQARATLSVELRPLRAGLNLLSATAECQIVVTNTGNEPARDIRVHATLLTAHAGQDADLATVNAAPVSRPVTAAFTLTPGETRMIRSVSAVPRDAIHSINAANRPMFVPIVAVNILYATGAMPAQTARAWAIGVERVDTAKLAPFWLDTPARMYDGIAARPHAVTIDR
jgi:hypothetical protein